MERAWSILRKLWDTITEIVKIKAKEKVAKEKVAKKDVTAELRTIHTSWMLWLVAVAFTIIIAPHMFFMYSMPYAFVLIMVIVGLATIGGYIVGRNITNNNFKVRLNPNNSEVLGLEGRDLWFARISFLILVPLILILDVASVTAESYRNGMITQYHMYAASVTLLVITTMILAMLLIKYKKRDKRDV
jgi:CDP-diglyceride synthetase